MVRKDLLTGSRLYLAPLEESDAEAISTWEIDNGFLRLMDSSAAVPRTASQIAAWIKQTNTANTFRFGIRTNDTNRLLGTLSIGGIEWNHQVGEISIGIGEVQNQGQGFGREAMNLGLDFSFLELNLHRVTIGVFEYNDGAIHLYESLGFQHEGGLREYLHRDGRRYDMLLMGLLRPEWEALQAAQD